MEKFLSGLTVSTIGATAATAYRGGTSSGAPTTGTFAVGDYVVGQNGSIYVCTSAGTPGTWSSIFPINFVTTPSALGVAAVGTATTAARADHVHAVPNVDALANVVTASKASGDVLTWDGTHWINSVPSGGTGGSTPLAVSAPPAVGTAAVGTSTFAARSDHVHAQQPAVQPTGLTGTTSNARFVGGNASAAPTTGTFSAGDYMVAQNGLIFVCKTAGSPGTWDTFGGLATSTTPSALGTAAIGSSVATAHADHVHAMPGVSNLTDTLIASPATGQVLAWNGTKWANTASGAGANALQRVVYNTGTSSYPTRPTGYPAGMVDYLGPVQPSDWISGDTWTDNS